MSAISRGATTGIEPNGPAWARIGRHVTGRRAMLEYWCPCGQPFGSTPRSKQLARLVSSWRLPVFFQTSRPRPSAPHGPCLSLLRLTESPGTPIGSSSSRAHRLIACLNSQNTFEVRQRPACWRCVRCVCAEESIQQLKSSEQSCEHHLRIGRKCAPTYKAHSVTSTTPSELGRSSSCLKPSYSIKAGAFGGEERHVAAEPGPAG